MTTKKGVCGVGCPMEVHVVLDEVFLAPDDQDRFFRKTGIHPSSISNETKPYSPKTIQQLNTISLPPIETRN
jgi:hypothetical protein